MNSIVQEATISIHSSIFLSSVNWRIEWRVSSSKTSQLKFEPHVVLVLHSYMPTNVGCIFPLNLVFYWEKLLNTHLCPSEPFMLHQSRRISIYYYLTLLSAKFQDKIVSILAQVSCDNINIVQLSSISVGCVYPYIIALLHLVQGII